MHRSRILNSECKTASASVESSLLIMVDVTSQALTILKKIPESSIGKLGMNELVARPEGLIMKCVPIPPNCTRTTDNKYVNNTTAVRFGTVCADFLSCVTTHFSVQSHCLHLLTRTKLNKSYNYPSHMVFPLIFSVAQLTP